MINEWKTYGYILTFYSFYPLILHLSHSPLVLIGWSWREIGIDRESVNGKRWIEWRECDPSLPPPVQNSWYTTLNPTSMPRIFS